MPSTCDNKPPCPSIIADTSDRDREIEALYWRVFGPGWLARTASRLREGNRLDRRASRLLVSPDGETLASARVWPVTVGTTGEGDARRPALLGPVAVVPRVRGSGLGLGLCRATIAAAWSRGYTDLVLVGDPGYFSKLGFVVAERDLVLPAPIAPGRLLVLVADRALPPLNGSIGVPRSTTLPS